eukprot:gene1995-biopygen377
MTQFQGSGVSVGASSGQGVYGNVYTCQPSSRSQVQTTTPGVEGEADTVADKANTKPKIASVAVSYQFKGLDRNHNQLMRRILMDCIHRQSQLNFRLMLMRSSSMVRPSLVLGGWIQARQKIERELLGALGRRVVSVVGYAAAREKSNFPTAHPALVSKVYAHGGGDSLHGHQLACCLCMNRASCGDTLDLNRNRYLVNHSDICAADLMLLVAWRVADHIAPAANVDFARCLARYAGNADALVSLDIALHVGFLPGLIAILQTSYTGAELNLEKRMRILIIGATGMIGQALARYLFNEHSLVLVGRNHHRLAKLKSFGQCLTYAQWLDVDPQQADYQVHSVGRLSTRSYHVVRGSFLVWSTLLICPYGFIPCSTNSCSENGYFTCMSSCSTGQDEECGCICAEFDSCVS